MKKKYVAPESALLTLNFSENIAASSLSEDQVQGMGIIKFSQISDGCRKYYTNHEEAPVSAIGNSFWDYYNDMQANNYTFLLFTCLVF